MNGVRWREIVDGRLSSNARTNAAYCTFRNWPDFRINTPRAIAGALGTVKLDYDQLYTLDMVDPFEHLQLVNARRSCATAVVGRNVMPYWMWPIMRVNKFFAPHYVG